MLPTWYKYSTCYRYIEHRFQSHIILEVDKNEGRTPCIQLKPIYLYTVHGIQILLLLLLFLLFLSEKGFFYVIFTEIDYPDLQLINFTKHKTY